MLDSGVRPLLSLPVVLGMAVQRDTGMKQRKVRLMEVFVPPPVSVSSWKEAISIPSRLASD